MNRWRPRPASLRGRVVLGTLTLLAVLLSALFVTVDVLLSARLHSDLRTRLTDRVALAEQLDGALSPQQLVDRLRGDGVSALLCSDSGSDGDGGSTGGSGSSSRTGSAVSCVQADGAAPAPPGGAARSDAPQRPGQPGRARTGAGPGGRGPVAPPGANDDTVQSSGSVLFLRTTLPSSGQTLTLSVDSSQVASTLRGLILLEVVGGLALLVVAGLLLVRVVGVALRPLDHMTSLARQIAGGDRGRRLNTGRPDTELGRTAGAFDDMLDELESALDAAAAAQARLRSLLSDVSHELRSPLAGLAVTTETLLRDEPDRAERERAYVTLVRETRRANRLVDDLLTMTRLDTGMALTTAPVDLTDVVGQEVERLRLLAPRLTVTLDGPATAPVHADATRLGQVFGNLLGNARTAAGADATIAVRIERAGDTWQTDVVDDGPGVPAGDEERIFERLVRLDESRSRDRGGFGLGLPIARALARAHGGDVWCVPRPRGSGACFRVTLPVRQT